MIYEFALEPELVATWTDRPVCAYFKQSFGFGQGRVVSRFPKRWKRLVWEAYDGTDEFGRKRLEELLVHLSERMVKRSNINWEAPASWIENAEREHERRLFHAILSRVNPRNHAHVLTESDIYEDSATRWDVKRGLTVGRNAAEMAEVVAPMLKCSSVVIFVDPYFRPGHPRYLGPFAAFLERIADRRPGGEPDRIEVHASTKYECTEVFFRRECTRKFQRWIPNGMPVRVRRLRERQGGEQLHNRYILTDLGGVAFGTGLDDGGEGATDDITLLERDQYELRWSQYDGDPPAGFEQEGASVEVTGTRKPAMPS